MRFKTLGIVLISAMALFTAFYWITDPARRDTAYKDQFTELVAYGGEMFAPDKIIYPVAISAAGFDPATISVEVNAAIEFTSTLDSDVTVRATGSNVFEVELKPGKKATTPLFAVGGLTQLTGEGLAGSLEVTSGPETLNPSAANCARCHGRDGRGGQVGDTGRLAPNLHSKSIFEKLKAAGSFTAVRRPGDAPDYVNLVIRYGGVVVSGDVKSPMPAWSIEAGGSLTIHQVDALTALVETWVLKAKDEPDVVVPDTVEAGKLVFSTAGCAGCHGADLKGIGQFPSLLNIGNEPVVDLPFSITGLDKLKADYAANARTFLEKWIRDSWTNYNGGVSTNMPQHPVGSLSDSALKALITFLLTQKQ